MKKNNPTPLYPGYNDLIEFYFDDYPELTEFLNSLPDWCLEHFNWAKSFLEYTGRNKSVHT